MDTSPEYKKQCEKAERCAPELFYKASYNAHDFTFKIEGNDLLWWLPRQDQLQIISGLPWEDFDIECLEYKADTKEQSGIQVVMWWKGNKVWDGENW